MAMTNELSLRGIYFLLWFLCEVDEFQSRLVAISRCFMELVPTIIVLKCSGMFCVKV